MFAEPLACWREVSIRTRKTKVDWAIEMGGLLEGRYADCKKVLVVCDNLSTHTLGAFYEAFEPARARAIVSRIASEEELRAETAAWAAATNSTQRGVECQMKIDDARIRLLSVYPKSKQSQSDRRGGYQGFD